MSEASYTAWDDNLYEWPPPDGWYEASDGRWWPEGYGPPAGSAGDADASRSAHAAPPGGDLVPDPVRADAGPGGAESPFTATSAANGSGAGADVGFDPERTSLFPAGGFALADPAPSDDRSRAEPRRRVYDELPPIDDVFGGIDPYSTIETPAHKIRSPAGGADDAADHGADDHGADDHGADDHGADDHGADDHGAADHGGAFGLGPVLDDELSFDNAFERVAESLREDRGDEPGATGPFPAAPDGSSNGRVPDGAGPAAGAGVSPGRSVSPGAGASGGPMGGTPLSGPELPPLPADPDATTVTESPYRAGPGTAGADDGATALIDVAALRRAPDGAGGAGLAFDGGRTIMASEGPPEVPALEGRFELPESLGGYVGAPTLERSSGPRRWWPLVVIGIAVLAAAGSIGAYLLLRGDGAGSGTETAADPNGQGAFANPYPVGTGVVVYYNDEATGEQRRWVIQVLEPVVDATGTLVSEASAQAPADGEVLAMARIRVAYQSGPEPGSVADLRFNAAGSVASASFDQTAERCSAVTDPIDVGATLLALESVEGNLCWRIPASELESLKLAVEAGPAAGTVHLALG